MVQNSITQIEELLSLILQAKEYSLEMLNTIEKLSVFTTQMQGRNSFIQHCLQEQAHLFDILIEQNPQMQIFQTSQSQIQEALRHSLALEQLSQRSLEVLDMSANTMQKQGGINKAQILLKGVIGCLDMLLGEKIEQLNKITNTNQNANQNTTHQNLENLKLHFKGNE